MRIPITLIRSAWWLAVGAAAALMAGCTTDAAENEFSQAILNEKRITGFYELSYPSMDGEEVPLSRYRGQVVMIVNTASRCGYTDQYEGLEKIHRKYRDRGLVIIGFPCNQFLGQEPGDNAEIVAFCQANYGVTFPLSQKIEVHGPEKLPLYAWLTNADAAFPGKIGWNFTKFLVDRSGAVVGRFSPGTEPEDEEIVQAIEKALSAPAP
jgi:glutathione peroxidase